MGLVTESTPNESFEILPENGEVHKENVEKTEYKAENTIEMTVATGIQLSYIIWFETFGSPISH